MSDFPDLTTFLVIWIILQFLIAWDPFGIEKWVKERVGVTD